MFNPKRKIAMYLKEKSLGKAATPHATSAPGGLSQAPISAAPPTGMPKPEMSLAKPQMPAPLYSQGASELNPKFFNLRKKLKGL